MLKLPEVCPVLQTVKPGVCGCGEDDRLLDIFWPDYKNICSTAVTRNMSAARSSDAALHHKLAVAQFPAYFCCFNHKSGEYKNCKAEPVRAFRQLQQERAPAYENWDIAPFRKGPKKSPQRGIVLECNPYLYPGHFRVQLHLN